MTIPHEHMYIDCYAVKKYIDDIITFFSLLSMCSRISMADASALTRITLRPFNIALKSFTRKSLEKIHVHKKKNTDPDPRAFISLQLIFSLLSCATQLCELVDKPD